MDLPSEAVRASLRAAGGATPFNAAALLLPPHDPARVALVSDGEPVTHGELRDAVARAGAVFRARGIRRGDRVGIKLPDSANWVRAFLGAMWCGGVAVAINPKIPADDHLHILRDGDFSLIVAESADDTPEAYRDRVVLVDDWLRELAAAAPIAAEPMGPEDPAFWGHSSGTSGRPKAVVHVHRFATEIERVSSERLGIGPDDRLFATSKMFFTYPQTNSLWAGLRIGATVIIESSWPTAESVVEVVAARRPTVLFSVPSLYRNLLKAGHAPTLAAHGIRKCVSAGEALPPSLRDEWQRQTGIWISNGYGASETLILVLVSTGDEHGLTASPGVTIEPMFAAAEGGPTRIRIRCSSQAAGYWERPDSQAENFIDGAFCPADLFARGDDGRWHFAGREDSLVKIHGRWVNLAELEERLTGGTPAILEGAAVSVPDADGVDAVAYFYVVPADAADATRAKLRAQADTLPPYQRPRWLHPVTTLPRTPTGKLLRRMLRELHRTLA